MVLVFAVVGFCDVLQQMPRAVTGELPSPVMLPPPVAVVLPIAYTVVVDNKAVDACTVIDRLTVSATKNEELLA